MAPADQPSAPAAPPPAASASCANCGAPMAPDQRYCLACGTRRGDPRVPISPPAAEPAAQPQQQQGRPADVSPLAAVIGIALLGGMLLIGVLIGRGDSNDQTTPAPVVQVGEGGTTSTLSTGTESGGGGQTTPSSVTSEWPSGTNGFTIQVSSIGKSSATPESVDAAKQTAIDEGALGRVRPRLRPVFEPPSGELHHLLGRLRQPQGRRGGARRPRGQRPQRRGDRGLGQGRLRPTIRPQPRPRVDRRGHGPERAVAADRRCHGVGEMSPSVIERLKPYFKTRPRPRPGAAPPPAAAQNATAPATPAQPTLRRGSGSRSDPEAQPAKPKKRRGLRRKAARAQPPRRLRGCAAPAQAQGPADAGRGRAEARRGPGRSAGRCGALLASRREQLSREFAQQQSDLGGLVYEMATRDQFRPDLVARQAAKLQAVDLELTAVERALGIATSEPGARCPSCGSPARLDAAYCGRCGAPLTRSLHQAASDPALAPQPAAPQPAARTLLRPRRRSSQRLPRRPRPPLPLPPSPPAPATAGAGR